MEEAIYLLNKLSKASSGKKFVEWSFSLTEEALIYRHKPTLYLYPSVSNSNSFFNKLFYSILDQRNCPKELVKLHQELSLKSLYQGIRLSINSNEKDALYIHQEHQNFLTAYKWNNQLIFQKVRYQHYQSNNLKTINQTIHPDLLKWFKFFDLDKNISGFWVQKINNQVKEVYFSFSNRIAIAHIQNQLKPLLREDTFNQLTKFGSITIKNIGFDIKNPKLTFYVTFPLNESINSYSDILSKSVVFFEEKYNKITI